MTRRRKPKKLPPPEPPPPVPIDAFGRSDLTFSQSPPTAPVEPQPEHADKQRRHFFKLLTVQNVVGVLVVVAAIIAAFYRLQTQVTVNANDIDSLKRQQQATWQRLQEIRTR